ncbi:MAG TPA: substrate-binding domain-containing protein [Stellaceae bacterium]|jgi:phosphate transport system substrate-binding protein
MQIHRRALIGGLLGATSLGPSLLRRPARAASAALSGTPPSDPASLEDYETVLLRIAGDDASGATIIPKIAANFLSTRGASNVEIGDAVPPWTTKVTGRLLSGAHMSVLIKASTTTDGYTMFAAGEIDIWLSGVNATSEQLQELRKRGSVALTQLARYGIVVAVHPSNPIESLSYNQVADIFRGVITDWKDVGGTPGPISIYGRASGSVSAKTFETFMYERSEEQAPTHLMNRFSDLRQALASDPNGIGYLNLPSAADLKAIPLTVRGEVPSRPDMYGLGTGDYPLAVAALLYRFERSGSDPGAAFVHEALSPRSEYLLREDGFQNTAPTLLLPEIHPLLPVSFDGSELTTNGLRVSTTIRFAPGSTELDAMARSNIKELVQYLRRLSPANDQLAHLCYSDDAGDTAKNREISRQLGNIFASGLRDEYFVPGQLIPLGAELLLAEDRTTASRRLNRRVETWLRP